MWKLQQAAQLSVLLLLWPALLSAQESIEATIKRLASDNDKHDRIAAAGLLRESEDVRTLEAREALATLCQDEDAEVRNAGVLALGTLCERHGRACPLTLIDAMFDADELVRTNAGGLVSLFDKLPRAALPILFEYAADPDPERRSDALVSLGRAGANDPTVLIVLRQAVRDRDVMVRTHAVAGLWHATKDLSEVVPHWLRFIDDAQTQNDPDARRTAAERSAVGRLAAFGAAELLDTHGGTDPDRLGKVLVDLLDSDLPAIRRRATERLGKLAADSEAAKRILQQQQADKSLRKLLKDEDPGVREAAAAALKQLD